MHLARWILTILLVAGLAGFLPACAEDEEDEPSFRDWIDRGKELLADGDGAGAYLAFQEALDIKPGHGEGLYGVVLSDVLQFADTVELLLAMLDPPPAEEYPADMVAALCQKLDGCGVLADLRMDYAGCIGDGGGMVDQDTIACIIDAPTCDVLRDRCFGLVLPPNPELCRSACVRFASCGFYEGTTWYVPECVARCEETYLGVELECFVATNQCEAGRDACFVYVGDTVSGLVGEFWLPIGEEMGRAVADLDLLQADFEFELDFYSVDLLPPLVQPTFSGIHDMSDVSFFGAVYAAIDALFSAVLALDLDLNPTLLQALGLTDVVSGSGFLPIADVDDGVAEDIAAVVAVLDSVLGDPVYREFLTLRAEDGESYLQWSGAQIGMIFGRLAEMIERVAAETDDQTDDVIRFVDDNGDGLWNEPEALIIPGVIEMKYDFAWIVHDIALALKVDFTDGYAFRLEELAPLFDYLNLQPISAAIGMLDAVGIDAIDLGVVFREPSPAGLRPLLEDSLEILEQLQASL